MTEQERIFEQYQKQLLEDEKKVLIENSELIEAFIDFCSNLGLTLKKSNFKYVQSIGVIAEYPNILSFLNNQIQIDKEGLTNFNFLDAHYKKEKFASGYLFHKEYMAMAHRFFRRGHGEYSNFSPRFIEVYWEYINQTADKFIALDFNKVRINVDNIMYMELDTWYGAKFDKKIENIEDGIVKLAPPMDLDSFYLDFLFGGVYSLDVKWYTKGNIKVFQAKEFKAEDKTVKIGNQTFFPAKYIHAEFNISTGMFRHFDGALHLYSEDDYYARRASDFNYNEKNDLKIKSKSEKLFKINGDVKLKDWIELTCHFFTANPLIIEYFEGALPTNVTEIISAIRKDEK